MQVQVGAKRLGVALGAGGIRGAAHIGVLRSLSRHGLVPQALSGSSAGAVVAALYSVGYTPDQMEELALSMNAKQLYDPNLSLKSLFGATINTILSLLHVPSRYDLPFPQGLIQGKAWEQYLFQQLGPILVNAVEFPIAILATDIDTGQGIAFSQESGLAEVSISDAPLAQAVRASSAIPGVFCPAHVQGRTLVDGGVKASVPASLLQGLGSDVILAVDLGYAGQRDHPVDNIHEIIAQSLDIMGAELTDYQLTGTASLVIRPVANDVGLRDFARIPQLIRLGEETMDRAIPALQALLGH